MQVGQVLEKVFLIAVLVLVCRFLIPIGVFPEQQIGLKGRGVSKFFVDKR